ncbi:hypothetical protein MNBD_ALPHA12-2268 [hydrothermal vent metagenome]|uniref:Uncharacterized protein n=1 Tax=hydrothermal vent metagenome TaxID=652676 RepID=A0A3B0U4W7_9ZZZZ
MGLLFDEVTPTPALPTRGREFVSRSTKLSASPRSRPWPLGVWQQDPGANGRDGAEIIASPHPELVERGGRHCLVVRQDHHEANCARISFLSFSPCGRRCPTRADEGYRQGRTYSFNPLTRFRFPPHPNPPHMGEGADPALNQTQRVTPVKAVAFGSVATRSRRKWPGWCRNYCKPSS